jgi:dienelactone hydrolase
MLSPEPWGVPQAKLLRQSIYQNLSIEQLSWQLPYGPPTEAVFLKPLQHSGRLPAVLAFHDHGGNKYFGWKKIAHGSEDLHQMMRRHRIQYYGGLSWANALAQRGYAVLIPDAFTFGSRRIRVADVSEVLKGRIREVQKDRSREIRSYNRFAAAHEHVIAKSLFCAGTTWPGVLVAEDRCALGYLCSRPDVDPARIGSAGLSGGGLRTAYLAATDPRIACACCVGMMSTWRDFLLNKCHTHTWMIFIPGLPLDLDYPDVLGLRAPRATLVQYNSDDALFTLDEMRRADRILAEIFVKAGAPQSYRGTFYPGPHKFDRAMQADAFDWFDHCLKRTAP